MSRLGKTPIPLPKGVEFKAQNKTVSLKGPKGTLNFELPAGISAKVQEQVILVEKDPNVEMPKTTHGFCRAMLNNMVVGVSKGFEKRLTLIGVGYRAALKGKTLELSLGFSHPVELAVPQNVQITVDKSTTIIITGNDKHAVGQFAAEIRAKKKPEPYKGKGVRYEDEIVRKKAGKAAKGKTAT